MSIEALRAAVSGGHAAIAILLEVEGSAPRGAGTMMAVLADGKTVGTVGGGKIEALATERARALLAGKGNAGGGNLVERLDFDLTGPDARGDTMICGGSVRLLIEAFQAHGPSASEDERAGGLADALRLIEGGGRAVLVFGPAPFGLAAVLDGEDLPACRGTVARGTAAREVARASEDVRGGIPLDHAAALAALAAGEVRPGAADGRFYAPLLPPDRLLILGAGHVGRALAEFSTRAGFAVTVADPRPELIDRASLIAGVQMLSGSFEESIADFPFDSSTSVVVVSPDHLNDLACVRAILGREYRYAGFIGSMRKVRMILGALKAEGFDPGRVDALCAPVGLDIGAETPEEIAVAILAELVAWKRASPRLPDLALGRMSRRGAG